MSIKEQYLERVQAWKAANPMPQAPHKYRSVPDSDTMEAVQIAALGMEIGESRLATSKALCVPSSSLWNWSNKHRRAVDSAALAKRRDIVGCTHQMLRLWRPRYA
jgi:hypothetical protein